MKRRCSLLKGGAQLRKTCVPFFYFCFLMVVFDLQKRVIASGRRNMRQVRKAKTQGRPVSNVGLRRNCCCRVPAAAAATSRFRTFDTLNATLARVSRTPVRCRPTTHSAGFDTQTTSRLGVVSRGMYSMISKWKGAALLSSRAYNLNIKR